MRVRRNVIRDIKQWKGDAEQDLGHRGATEVSGLPALTECLGVNNAKYGPFWLHAPGDFVVWWSNLEWDEKVPRRNDSGGLKLR